MTQTNNSASACGRAVSPTPSTYALCTLQEHSFPPSPSRETSCGVPVRPQMLSSSVFPCHFTGEPLKLVTSPSAPPSRFGPREAGDGEMRQAATGRRQGGDRKTTGWRQEDDRPAAGKRQGSDRKRQAGDREATGNSDRRATGGNGRRATGERQEGATQKEACRQETTGSDRKRQDSDRGAAGKRQGSDRGGTGERQDSDREATGKRQGSDRGLKVPKQRQGGDREATGWRQEGEVARI